MIFEKFEKIYTIYYYLFKANFGLRQGGSFTILMLIRTLFLVQHRGHWRQSHYEVGSQSQAKHISVIQTRNFLTLSIMLNPTVLLSSNGSNSGFNSTFKKSVFPAIHLPLTSLEPAPIPLKGNSSCKIFRDHKQPDL